MPNDSSAIVQKLWNYCNVLRDDGISYGDYVEQLTYLLFLKMADEQTKPPYNKDPVVPAGKDWEGLVAKEGAALETHYRDILDTLALESGTLGVIFRKSQNRIQDPVKLKQIIQLINDETWSGLDTDVKGDIYDSDKKKAGSRQNLSDPAFFSVYFGDIMAISIFFFCFRVEMRYNIPKSLNQWGRS